MDTRPRIFIASTIYDFRDLRSALKYWLEELGYAVQLSEFNDFRHDLDLNSFDACLKSLEECMYFVLLIGGRVGGWFNFSERISITRQEYRTAYNLFLQGKLKIVAFVRKEVWDLKEDRKALLDFLTTSFVEEKELSITDAKAIANHSSKIVTDADAVFDFIREVTRLDEMKDSLASNSPKPPGNWVHVFVTFNDLIDALRLHFLEKRGLRRAALIASLKYQLALIVQALTTHLENGIDVDFKYAREIRPLLKADDPEITLIPNHLITPLILWTFYSSRKDRLASFTLLDSAIASGEFLHYNFEETAYELGPVQVLMIELRTELERLANFEKNLSLNRQDMLARLVDARDQRTDAFVHTAALAELIMIADRHENILKLAISIYSHIKAGDASASHPELRPLTPFPDQEEQVQKESPSIFEALDWLERMINSNNLLGRRGIV